MSTPAERLTTLLDRSQASQFDIFPATEEVQADIRALLTENETMRVSLTAALKVIRPLWKALEPILESAAYVDYFAHREECWYTGDPSTADGRGCEEHNRLYDAWQAVIC